MEISSNAWHMRVTRKVYGEDYEPVGLCLYFHAVWTATLGLILYALTSPIWWSGARMACFLGQRIASFGRFSTKHDEGFRKMALVFRVVSLLVIVSVVLLYLGFGLWLAYSWVVAHPRMASLILGLTLVGIAFLVGLSLGIAKAIDCYNMSSHVSREPKPIKPREPSLLWAYLVARKQKICPIITVREE